MQGIIIAITDADNKYFNENVISWLRYFEISVTLGYIEMINN